MALPAVLITINALVLLEASAVTLPGVVCHSQCLYRTNTYEGLEARCLNITLEGLRCLTDMPQTTRFLYIEGQFMDVTTMADFLPLSLPYLRSLAFRNSDITEVGRLFGIIDNSTWKALVSLDLSKNQIEEARLDQLLQVAPKAISIDLSENRIRLLRCGHYADGDHLQFLSLSGNELVHLSNFSFECLRYLVELDLSDNLIGPTLKSEVFSVLTFLKILNLRNNNLNTIQTNAFMHTGHVEQIILSGNHFPVVPVRPMCLLSRLKHLALDENQITHVPAEISCLSSLWFLYLQNNAIRSIDEGAFSELYNLKAIWLNNNQLTSLPNSLRHCLLNMDPDHFNLFGNRLSCDCHLVWLVRWFHHKHQVDTTLEDRRVTKCSGPHHLEGVPLQEAQLHQMLCIRVCKAGDETCDQCPPFSEVLPSSTTYGDACTCLPGYMAVNSTSCQACEVGTFSETSGSLTCQTCSAGSLTTMEASDRCECQVGYTAFKHTCRPCTQNTYKATTGSGSCNDCPAFSRGPPASNTSTLCRCLHGPTETSRDKTQAACRAPKLHDIALDGKDRWRTTWVLSLVVTTVLVLLCMLGTVCLTERIRTRWSSTEQEESPEEQAWELKTVDAMVAPYSVNELYQCYEIPVKSLVRGRKLGQGAFGVVYEAAATGLLPGKDTPVIVAVKCLKDRPTREEGEALRSELDVMVRVGRHPNVIGLLAACTQQGQLMLVMEYASRGNLLDYLQSHDLGLRSRDPLGGALYTDVHGIAWLKQITNLAQQVAQGMGHLGNMKCVHRDLAARNVLLTESLTAKVSDFGLSRDVYGIGYYHNNSKGRLPFKWMSPEALLGGRYTVWSDVWSYGVLLWEMSTAGGSPYPGVAALHLAELLGTGYRMRRPDSCPPRLYNIMLHCWHEEPTERPTFQYLHNELGRMLKDLTDEPYLEMAAGEKSHLMSDYMDMQGSPQGHPPEGAPKPLTEFIHT